MSIYDFVVKDGHGNDKSLSDYRGKVLLIVNTASMCGFTPQYAALQTLYDRLHGRGLEVLAFPCNQFANQEPGEDAEIQEFCKLNYGLTFPVMGKIDVNGKSAHPLYRFLRSQKGGFLSNAIKWNFTKFLVDSTGNVVGRYAPAVLPESLTDVIETLLPQVESSLA